MEYLLAICLCGMCLGSLAIFGKLLISLSKRWEARELFYTGLIDKLSIRLMANSPKEAILADMLQNREDMRGKEPMPFKMDDTGEEDMSVVTPGPPVDIADMFPSPEEPTTVPGHLHEV